MMMKIRRKYTKLLKSCAKKRDLLEGSKIHAILRSRGLIKKDIFIGCTLLYMYATCGSIAKAQEVFDELPAQDVVSWTALIDAYVQLGLSEEAFVLLERMQSEGIAPNEVTFLRIINACSNLRAIKKGKEFHSLVITQGFFQGKPELGNALVDMYAKCGALIKAKQVFDELTTRNVVSWNVLIAGYTQHGYGEKALACFDKMHANGISQNEVTFLSALKACSSAETLLKGMEIHGEMVRRGYSGNMDLTNTLLDMYIKCGTLARAQQVFCELSIRTIVSWNVLISGCAQYGLGEEAFNYYEWMQEEGFYPDAVTFLCILKVCGMIGAAEKGEIMHSEIVRQKLLDGNHVLGNALVDMHAKCGALRRAQQVFGELPKRDVVAWTSLLAGYAQAGSYGAVFNLFNAMLREHIQPNLVTFTIILSACSHSIVMDKGQSYYEGMCSLYGITPTLEHCTCMVDLLGRAGFFDRAIDIIYKMQAVEYLPAWLALLGACRKWGDLKHGKLAFEHVIWLDTANAIAYAYISDIYTMCGMQEEVDRIESLVIAHGLKRLPYL